MLIHNSATKCRRETLNFIQPTGNLILDRANIRQKYHSRSTPSGARPPSPCNLWSTKGHLYWWIILDRANTNKTIEIRTARSKVILPPRQPTDQTVRASSSPILSQRDRLIAAPFGGFRHGFRPRARAQFAKYRLDMEFHGMQRDVQSARNGFIGVSISNRREHFEFARCQKAASITFGHQTKAGIPCIGRAHDKSSSHPPQRGIDLGCTRIPG